MRLARDLAIVAAVVGAALLSVAALRFSIQRANGSADAAARALCAAIPVGDSHGDAHAKALRSGGSLHVSDGGSLYVMYPGSPMEFAICYVDVADGRVTGTRFEHYDPE